MEISVLRKMEYEGNFIYIMQFDLCFQYLFCWKNEIYEKHIRLSPEWWRVAMWTIGFLRSPYTRAMIEQGEEIVLSGAMKSIEALKEKAV